MLPFPSPSSQKKIIFTNKPFPETNLLSCDQISYPDTGLQSRLKMLTHTFRNTTMQSDILVENCAYE